MDVELEIKRSQFLTRLRRVDTDEAARAVIDERRQAHWNATHNCTAYILTPDGRNARSSDDGEPAGTAGVPMLTTLQHNQLTNVVAVVTRYFGGIKLGGGGLIRAYSDAVQEAIEAIGIREVRLMKLLQVDVGYAEAGVIENDLRNLVLPSGSAVEVTDVAWTDKAHITVGVDEAELDAFETALRTLSAGSLSAETVGERWVG